MLFRVLNLSTLIYSKPCDCDVLYCTLIFHECDVKSPQYEGIWFFCGFWFRSAYNSNTLVLRTSCFWVPPCFQYDPFFLWLFHCSTLMHHVFSNLHEHFLLRSITFCFLKLMLFCVLRHSNLIYFKSCHIDASSSTSIFDEFDVPPQ